MPLSRSTGAGPLCEKYPDRSERRELCRKCGISERQHGKDQNRTQCEPDLGLLVTKKPVEEHRGTIDIDTRLGYGSVFTVTLPERPETARDQNDK